MVHLWTCGRAFEGLIQVLLLHCTILQRECVFLSQQTWQGVLT